MATDLDLLRDLCAAPAPTGFEAPVQEIVRRRLSGGRRRPGRPPRQRLGRRRAQGLAARRRHRARRSDRTHRHLRRRARLRVVRRDRRHRRPTPARAGTSSSTAPRGPVNGVVGRRPSHKMSKDERAKAPEISEQWLDVGAAQPRRGSRPRAGRRPHHLPAAVRAAGQRALRLAGLRQPSRRLRLRPRPRALRGAPATARLTALTTVHEETTFMGARAMAVRWQPDVIIVVDVDFASDDPGMDAKKLGGEVKLGAGPVIHRGAGSNHTLVELAREVAAAEGIPVQIKAMPGAPRPTPRSSWRAGRRRRCRSACPCATCTRPPRSCSRATRRPARCSPPASSGVAAESWDREHFVPRA